jgi:hypothetical protein
MKGYDQMDILTVLIQQLSDPKALEELGRKAGARPDQTRKVAQNALPVLLGALKQNAASPDGAKSLNKALEDHKNDNVSDITNFLKSVDTNDGAKILQHIFGSKNENVQKDLAQKAGVDTNQVSALLTQIAPLVLGTLGNQKKEQGGSDVMNLIGSVLGGFFKK